jgi:uncharacterized protein involved in outer membrane biogenesis
MFEYDIRELVEKNIDKNIESKVFFDPSKFSLSLFKEFPNPTASIGDFGIVGVEEFAGDTLISAQSFSISIDLFSLFGDQYRIKCIQLEKPRIMVRVRENGQANYEIVADSEQEEVPGDTTTNFNLSIDHWSINNGFISYVDEQAKTSVILEGIEHKGSGDISLDIYDLKTTTDIKKVYVVYDEVDYLDGQSVFADATININMDEFKFTFKENEIRVNDFPLAFEGFVAMPDEDINMDLQFSSTNSSLKSLYSLVPGAFTEDYQNVRAQGVMDFLGFVNGTYNENTFPAYELQLTARDGMIAYPDLPKPIENINIDMKVACTDGNIDNTSININQFHLDIGSNPINGSLTVRNLVDYSMKADISAKLNLAELTDVFPIEGSEMRGLFSLNVKADGKYDSTRNIMPAINATMSLADGYIKSDQFPKALENMSFDASVDASSGKMEEGTLKVQDFRVLMEGEQLMANLMLNNFVDYEWDLSAEGGLDLEVISEVYPMEDMHYSGHLTADIQTSGKYSDLEAERYDRLPTSGTLELTDFTYNSSDLPQGMNITRSVVNLDPRLLQIQSFNGKIGKSDLDIQGAINNYIDYVFADNAVLRGEMTLKSKLLDLNELMMADDETTTSEASEDTSDIEAVAIPKNIDFAFNAIIDQIKYDNLNLRNARGLLTVREGVLDLKNLTFDLLGGAITMNGEYNTQDPDDPKFDYQLDIKQLSIPQAYTNFTTVQTFAPMAQLMNGNFSTEFNISGRLKEDLTPVYASLDGNGIIKIADAFMKESKLVSGIAGFMKSDLGSSQLTLKDVIMKASIENGRAHVSPFDLKLAGHEATISGSIGADGTLDYDVQTEVEAGIVGQQINQLMANLTGSRSDAPSSTIKLSFNVGGTYDNPKINLLGTTADGKTATVQEAVRSEVKQEVQEQVESAKQQTEERLQEETKKLTEEVEKQMDQQVDTLKKEIAKNLEEEAGEILGDELDSTANELKESLKNLFKKKKNTKEN